VLGWLLGMAIVVVVCVAVAWFLRTLKRVLGTIRGTPTTQVDTNVPFGALPPISPVGALGEERPGSEIGDQGDPGSVVG
jgi:hypothetical protein